MKEISLYIHVPFCKQKCLYCDFTSFSGKEKCMEEYTEALSKEISSHKGKKIKTIFLGGGTPTYLSLNSLKILKKSIDRLDKSIDVEFTVEGNPGTFTKEKLEVLKEMGVNRLSIGLQAWQGELLKSLGRIHTRQEFLDSYNMAREVGFDNINIDLMFGLPGQTLEQWSETLESVVSLKPEHLSCYSLIIEEGTPMERLYNENKISLPDEDIERKMYALTLEYLNKNGYSQYEISNFSKINRECKHNLVYWNLEEYIGCGVSAHSYVDGYRYSNVETIEDYIQGINSEMIAVMEKHKNSAVEDMEEFMFMGLRKINGISKSEFNKRFLIDIHDVYGSVIKKYIQDKLILDSKDRIALTPKGVEVSNSIMADFMQM